MVQRIEQTVGIKPTATGDADGSTFINFSRELTAQEKTLLDGVMTSSPTLPPNLPGTKFIVKDLYNQRAAIGTAMGFPYKVYYSESVLGSGNVDQLELHFSQTLTTTQRNKVITEFGKLITLKP